MLKAEYKILTSDKLYQLEEDVVKYMADGFIPQGGVAVSAAVHTRTNSTDMIYAQAMVKVRAVEQ